MKFVTSDRGKVFRHDAQHSAIVKNGNRLYLSGQTFSGVELLCTHVESDVTASFCPFKDGKCAEEPKTVTVSRFCDVFTRDCPETYHDTGRYAVLGMVVLVCLLTQLVCRLACFSAALSPLCATVDGVCCLPCGTYLAHERTDVERPDVASEVARLRDRSKNVAAVQQ